MRVWHLPAMNAKAWLKQEMDRRGVSQAELARRLGSDFDRSKISKTLSGARQLGADELIEWAGKIGALAPLPAAQEPARPTASHDATIADIPEVDARTGAGLAAEGATVNVPDGAYVVSEDQTRAMWSMPLDYLRFELRVPRMAVRLVEVIGDSMHPTLQSGDRIMVNTADRRPSPPGIFALWDGLGVVVKRVEHIPNTDPLVYRIGSDNPHHATYERTEGEVHIIGRVVWYGRRI